MADHHLTYDRLRELVDYNPSTGTFRWRVADRRRKVGQKAGGAALGYWSLGIDKRKYQAHRLAWLYVYGAWPDGEVDHINRDRQDNRIQNLRLASREQNGANCSLSRSNTSGVKGVTWCKRSGKWKAAIMVKRNRLNLGYYDSVANAAAAYDSAAARAFGCFASLNAEISADG